MTRNMCFGHSLTVNYACRLRAAPLDLIIDMSAAPQPQQLQVPVQHSAELGGLLHIGFDTTWKLMLVQLQYKLSSY